MLQENCNLYSFAASYVTVLIKTGIQAAKKIFLKSCNIGKNLASYIAEHTQKIRNNLKIYKKPRS